MNDHENKRLNDMREDLQQLRKDINRGLVRIENQIKSQDTEARRNQESLRISCRERRESLSTRISAVETYIHAIEKKFNQKWNDLDKKLFKLFIVGNGVGIILGSIFTLLFQWLSDF